jgi:hypothetical protein
VTLVLEIKLVTSVVVMRLGQNDVGAGEGGAGEDVGELVVPKTFVTCSNCRAINGKSFIIIRLTIAAGVWGVEQDTES